RDGLRQRLNLMSTAAAIAAEAPEPEVSLRRESGERRSALLSLPLARRLEEMLAATGNSIRLWHLVVTAAAGALAVGLFAILVMGLSIPVVVVLAVAAGIAAPACLVRHMQHRFQRQFVDAFPDALDL